MIGRFRLFDGWIEFYCFGVDNSVAKLRTLAAFEHAGVCAERRKSNLSASVDLVHDPLARVLFRGLNGLLRFAAAFMTRIERPCNVQRRDDHGHCSVGQNRTKVRVWCGLGLGHPS